MRKNPLLITLCTLSFFALNTAYAAAEEDFEDTHYTLSVSSGLAWDDYALTGSGTALSLPRTRGIPLSVQLLYHKPLSTVAAFIDVASNSTTYDGTISGVAYTLETRRSSVKLGGYAQIFSESSSSLLRDLWFGAAYGFYRRSVTQTGGSTVLMNPVTAWTPTFMIRYSPESGRLPLEINAHYTFFTGFSEKGPKTGYFTGGSNWGLQATYFFWKNENTSIGISAFMNIETLHYDGLGQRLVTNGSEKQTTFGIPLIVKLNF